MYNVREGRYLTLDGMRGVAAIAVAAFHLNPSWVPNGYLAVDFFFALSGFVIATAYTEKLRSGASLVRFFQARFVRLFPLFFAGSGLGALYSLQLLVRHGGDGFAIRALVQDSLLGVLMIPNPFNKLLYPLNAVFWSILFEIAVNVAFAVILIRIPKAALWCVTILSGVVLYLASNRIASVNGGPSWDEIDVGIIRTVFSFSVGMIIASLNAKPRRSQSYLSLAMIGILLLITVTLIRSQYQLMFDLIMIYTIIPLVLLAGTRLEPPSWVCSPFSFLGNISYALYASHWPIAVMAIALVTRLRVSYTIAMPIFIVVTIAVAAVLTKFWDQPVRRYIERRMAFRPLHSAMSQTA